MKCTSCGGSLAGKSDICKYCGSLNDTDLRGLHYYTSHEADSNRMCPRCEKQLQVLDLKLDGRFYIDRCETCLGIFFDSGELEYLLDNHVQHVHEVDYQKLNTLVAEQRKEGWPTGYVKCPVCQNLMNRKNYGARSGVIVDTCKEHGVWVDGGELGVLFRWAKAGGRAHDQERMEQRRQEELKNSGIDLEFWQDPRFEEESNENTFIKALSALFF